MKNKQVRKGVWETNSSSTHVITIAGDEEGFLMDTSLIPDKDGNIVLTGGEFGWDWEKYNDALTKANYCAVSRRDTGDYKMLYEVLKAQTGANYIIFNIDDDSYIDHNSYGKCEPAFASKAALRNFIFNRNSWLFTGNNNEDAPNKFYDKPGTVYTHRLEVRLSPENTLTWEFKSHPDEEELEDAISSLLSDVHYNGDTETWVIDEDSRLGDNDYFNYKSWQADVDLTKKLIPFVREGLFEMARRECPLELKAFDRWNTAPDGEMTGHRWTNRREKELQQLPENIMYVEFDVVKI